MFELACLLLNLRFAVHGEAICEKSLGEAMAANNAAGQASSALGELDDHAAIFNRHFVARLQRVVAGIDELFVMMRLGGMRPRRYQAELGHFFDGNTDRQSSVHVHVLDLGDLAMLFHGPEFFEDLVELLFVRHGKHFGRGDLAVMQFDAAIREPRDYGVVGDHDDGSSLAVQIAQQAQNNLFVGRIEIACRLVGQHNFRIIYQGSRDANPLLLATR